jgi:hypothetical protein
MFGPGEYVPEPGEGITDVKSRRCSCPICNTKGER